MNDKFIQIRGPFSSRQDLISYLKQQAGTSFNYITHCGIQSIPSHYININGVDFEIGKTTILDLNQVKINSLYFKQDEPAETIIDCVLD